MTSRFALAFAWLGLCLTAGSASAQVTPAGTVVRNVAQVSYDVAGGARFTLSNEVAVSVEPPDTRSRLAIARYAASPTEAALRAAAGPTQCFSNGGIVTLAAPVVAGVGVLDPATSLPLAETGTVHAGDAVFLRVDDADQDRDRSVRDTVQVRVGARDTDDSETVRLLETGTGTGVFVGYLPTRVGAALPGSCVLELARDSSLDVHYVDPRNASDNATAAGLVDPFGVVFDSTTGEPIDGVRVRLLTAAGLPAAVFGDDGVSRYPSEMITGQAVTDAGGTTYRLPRGVYRFPLVASGSYRLVVEPTEGHVFPSGAAVDALQRLPGAPYRLGDGSFGRGFVVAAPVITALDVPLDPQGSALRLSKSANTEVAAVGDFVAYELLVENGGRLASIRDITVADRLPPGLRYRRGSVRVDGQAAADPVIGADGEHLTFKVPLLAPGRSQRIRYVTELTVGVRRDEIVNTATATAQGGVASNEAQARVRVRNELFSDRSFIAGRVVAGGCDADPRNAPGVEGVAIYLEDGRYAVTDREGRYHFDGVTPGAHVVQADVANGGADLQFADCTANTRHAGRRHSQFVDLRAGALWRVDFRLEGPPPARSVPAAADTAARPVPVAPGASDAPQLAPVDFDSLQPGVRFLTPEEGSTPPIASLRIAISHFPGQRVALGINGSAVSALNFEGTETRLERSIAVSRWRGVDLRDGDNELVATVRDADGSTVATLTRTVHYGGGPVRAEFDREASVLVADGRTRPVVVLRLFDAYGKPARPGTIGAFRVNPPYRSWWEVQALDDNPLLASGAREPTFEVGPGGLARLELEPTTQAGNAVLALRFNERQSQEVRAWLEPAARDWIMVGLASGSAAWHSVSGNREALDASGGPAEQGVDGQRRIAFFAKGRVRGDALLTLAYDSARDRRQAQQRLQGLIEPDQYYLLYADGAEPRFEAASSEKLYVKLERRQFVALFGDFDTGLTVTELTRYNRSLTGFKADFAGERVGATGFAARTDLGAGRDELRGDGTSGLYRLTRTPIVIGSDKLRIEVRDRFRTERVLQRRELARFLDYRLDYQTGELFFKEPVPSRDDEFNPVFIVAEYETSGTGQEVTTAGARTSLRSTDGDLEVGASLVRAGAVDGDTEIAGVDLRWFATPVTELRAELARSRSDDPARREQATAYLAELSHVTDVVDARLYLREQQADFGVGQQFSTEAGTRKAGLDLRWKLSPSWSLESELLAQHALETAADRRLASGALRYEQDGTAVGVGLRHVDDQVPGQGSQRSEQAFVTGAVDVLDRRVTLRAAADATLGGRDDSVDYPARTLLGADWHLRDDVDLFAEWEHADGDALQSDMTRVGVRARPWERTQLLSSVSQEITENGPRSFANFGLTQGFRLSERWSFDVGVDQSNTLRGPGTVPLLTPRVPLASGSTSEDFLATFVGTQYHDERWTLTGRAERRTADSGRRWTFSGGWYREQSEGHSLSLALQQQSEQPREARAAERRTDLRFAWAWRPVGSSWIVFNRTDLQRERREDLLRLEETQRWINNTHANWQWRRDQQLGLQLGLRRVVGTFDAQRLRGTSVLLGGDYRLDLPWRAFGRALDLGLHGARLESREAGVVRSAAGLDVGITPATNVWLSIGYNVIGFDDADFAASRHTARGPYISVRIKADQDTFKDLRLDSLRAPR
jgi:uncharacterized repeat protein (TIGR01451 family)